MKKLISLIRACMTSDMNLFKIRQKKDGKKSSPLLPFVIAFFFMFAIWSYASSFVYLMKPSHSEATALAIFAFISCLFIIVEGIYKSGPLLFNCRDDQLLLSLPIKKSTVLFVRILKFYLFELAFNALFLIPTAAAYLVQAENINWTFFLTTIIMIFILPIIPIVISCILGMITTAISSRFKYKNLFQIVITMAILTIVFGLSFKMNNVFEYVENNSAYLNDLVNRVYYPAGLYSKLAVDFNGMTLLIFVLINIVVFVLGIWILSLVYFKINSNLKKSISTNVNIDKLTIKKDNKKLSLIKKELNTFFKTPVFIINAGFGLVLFIVAVVLITFKFDTFVNLLSNQEGITISKETILNNFSIVVLALVVFTSFMTSITNSVISLEGRNINILKSLPLKTKDILMSKIYSSLVLTTPVLLIGNIVLFVKFRMNIIESILLLGLSIILPLVSHFIGLIFNLKYPKLDFENSAEVVKQSTSSFASVMLGMLLLIISMGIIGFCITLHFNAIIILIIFTVIFIIVDIILYSVLISNGSKRFDRLSI